MLRTLRTGGEVGMSDMKTVVSLLEELAQDDWVLHFNDNDVKETAKAALALLKEQEDSTRILTGDLEDLQKEHERLLDKKIPLITNGQEVTYCKDCVRWIPGVITDNDDFIPPRCRRNSGVWSADEFCSNAERR